MRQAMPTGDDLTDASDLDVREWTEGRSDQFVGERSSAVKGWPPRPGHGWTASPPNGSGPPRLWGYLRISRHVHRRSEDRRSQTRKRPLALCKAGSRLICRSGIAESLGASSAIVTILNDSGEYPAQVQDPASLGLGQQLFAAMVVGFAMQHYYLDAKIWRMSKDKDVRENLGV